MKLIDLKIKINKMFKENNIDTNEANILLCETFCVKLDDLLKTENIGEQQAKKAIMFAKRRVAGEPIQKIFKRAYFFDYVFYVNNNVLCPRPETELLAEQVIKLANCESKILDLCTGSGCLAITIQKKTGAKMVASDVSKKALYVAKKNAKLLDADVKFVESDMFENIKEKFDIIVSNPPYIPTEDCKKLDKEVKDFDPIISLDGGKDGLDFYRTISQKAKKYLEKSGKILLEVGIDEAQEVAQMLIENGYQTQIKKDYNNIERIVIGELL